MGLVNLPLILGVGQCVSTILRLQHVLVLVGDLGRDAFKLGFEQGKQVGVLNACQPCSRDLKSVLEDGWVPAYPELVTVFARQHSLASWMSQVVPDSGNVDKHAAMHVDPPRINLIERIGLLPIDIMWVDLQQILSPSSLAWCPVVIRRHVVVGGKKEHAGFRYLTIRTTKVSLVSLWPGLPFGTRKAGVISGHLKSVVTGTFGLVSGSWVRDLHIKIAIPR